ncbi:MAG: DoxX family protein [Parachlamydiaceae bacterium]
MRWLSHFGQFVARVLLSLIFIVAGIGKVVNFSETQQYMLSAGITQFTSALLVVALLVELLGGVFLIMGYRTRAVALVLFLFLIPTTFIFHHFWAMPEPEKIVQSTMFFKNLAIMGGLLSLASSGPGKLAVDCCHQPVQ